MKENYLVLTGNEFGIDLPITGVIKFVTLEKAEELYDKYMEEYGAAGIWEIKENSMTCLKSDCEF